MSRITGYRDEVIAQIKTFVPAMLSVDWYDGLFDDTDIDEWILTNPSAWVAVRNITSTLNGSGELDLQLDMLVTVVAEDAHAPRDADATMWEGLEAIAILVNTNKFGDPNSNFPTDIKLSRIRDPGMRREGVALGVVEWMAPLTIGVNRAVQDWYYTDPVTGLPITAVPTNVSAAMTVKRGAATTSEVVPLPADDDADDEGDTGLSDAPSLPEIDFLRMVP